VIYSVVPRELEGKLLETLTQRYAGDPNVTVILDRRESERRRRDVAPDQLQRQQRALRDRRRRRVAGDLPALRGEV